VDRREQRWVFVAWAVLGLQLGFDAALITRAVSAEHEPTPPPPTAAAAPTPSDDVMPARVARDIACVKRLERAEAGPKEAIAMLTAYDPTCPEADRARRLLLDAMLDEEATASAECLAHAKNRQWKEAVSPCTAAFHAGCWHLPTVEVPEDAHLQLYGTLTRGGWRPDNEVLLALMRARDHEHVDTTLDCTPPPLISAEDELCTDYALAPRALKKNFDDLRILVAVDRYRRGQLELARDMLGDRLTWTIRTPGVLAETQRVFEQMKTITTAYQEGVESIAFGNDAQGILRLDDAVMADLALLGPDFSDSFVRQSAERISKFVTRKPTGRALGAFCKTLREDNDAGLYILSQLVRLRCQPHGY
jgi:hypothetical protein